MVEIIPVMDLMGGIAVSGKSGNRKQYTSLGSVFSRDSNPLEIANSLKIIGAKELYLADLDSIEKIGHNLDQVKMINTVIPVMLDCGIKNFDSFNFYLNFAYKLIIATETLESLEELHKIFNVFPKERIVISVDIKDGELYSKSKDFNLNLDEFKDELDLISPNEIILLDISRVGTGKGINEELINKFRKFENNLILGGGITKEDLPKLDDLGIKKVLIGSAIHNGEITPNF
ncbi:phosphoribosyl isomerase A [Methanobrevibacter cuticularis]|uniref:Phosphoribosyl isomerase A n=1 Tax=Methanobrevibacter cuticularis TaxID=47311 RepID=A0A166EB91_9EURY|nr:HisA/HisF family protein [Methanobrevibacter cuticularis]KZX16468.1 phosphoribosyl isomerase A [Methanobrevibacter cuticularis]